MPFNRNRFKRTELMLGSMAMDRLEQACVTVIGLGAVGSHAVEALARSGIGRLRLVDFDVITITNFNRQLLAVEPNMGLPKTLAAMERVKQINPDINVERFDTFCHKETFGAVFPPTHGDTTHSPPGNPPLHVVIDAIDSLNPKVNILFELVTRSIPVVSSMGAARRMDPCAVRTGDISVTAGCPLARSVRKRLRRRGIGSGIQCVYSGETVHKDTLSPDIEDNYLNGGRPRNPMGSLSMISGIFGYTAALESMKIILGDIVKW
ncbi:MAG: tRNA threonylcarbamoyladenosine dehydratase [Desulfamplus sp.]|nr:tRNA threonylcarbamoyladenosine dehydratase [Desulfamplus sp.]